MKQEQKNLVDYIIDELKGVDVTLLKLDPDFLKYLAEIIENQVKSKKDKNLEAKPNKMDILVDIIKKLFPHTPDADIEVAKNIVEFLLKNTLVKKTKLSKIMSFYLKKSFACPHKYASSYFNQSRI
jgi:hypothetical protein